MEKSDFVMFQSPPTSNNSVVNLHFPMVFPWFSYGFPMVFAQGTKMDLRL